MPVAVAGASVSAPLNTAPYSSVPSAVQSHMTPRPKPTSPTRLTMNAFFPAWAAAGRVYLNLFVFSMTMLVLAGDFLLLYVFWEAVGLCSYLLIGFWYTRPAAAQAGKKAFIVNRGGGLGF